LLQTLDTFRQYIPKNGFQVMNDAVFVSDYYCDRVFALKAGTGKVKWEKQVSSPRDLSLDSYRDRVYIFALPAGGRAIIALDAASGQELWSNASESRTYRGALQVLSLSDGRLFAVAGGRDGTRIMPLDPDTGEFGKPIVPPSPDLFRSSLFSSDYFWQIYGGHLQAWTIDNRPEWQSSYHGIDGCCLQAVSIRQNKVVIRVGSEIIALDQQSGTLLWSNPDRSVAGPIIVGDVVYILTIDAELQALDLNTGQQIGVRQFLPPEDASHNTSGSENAIGGSQLASDNNFILIYFADIDLMSSYLKP
jgi:outer membrane protein assembly factor BamB